MDNPKSRAELDDALSTYPLYTPQSDDDYVRTLIPTREELNKQLLNNWKYREIGFETFGRFLDELEITMCNIMPYYNQLYKSVEIMGLIEDPFGNVDVTETFTETRTETSSSSGSASGTSTDSSSGESTTASTDSSSTESSTNSASKKVSSDTPQGSLSITDIDSVTYANNVEWSKDSNTSTASTDGSSDSSTTSSSTGTNTSSSTSEGESETSGTTTHTFTKKGNQGVNTYAHDMEELRRTFLNVTNQIINDKSIGELFMNVY